MGVPINDKATIRKDTLSTKGQLLQPNLLKEKSEDEENDTNDEG